MFIKKKLVCCMLWLIIILPGFSQEGVKLISQSFDTFRKNALPEKLYVHTDKEFYLAGEIMWFRLYAVDGYFHKPLDLGKVAYMELLDSDNNPILQSKIQLEKGSGKGSLFMPVNINSGNYKLRAYTNWMKNSGAEYFFEKRLSIINTQKITETGKPVAPAVHMRFYPEGGNLVNGIASKIAFEVIDQAGRGIDCEGVILNERNENVLNFKTLKFGLGNFTMTPDAGRYYTAVVKLPGNSTNRVALPMAYDKGYVMKLDDADPTKIKINVKSANTENTPVYFFAHTRGVIVAAQEANLQNNEVTFQVDKESLQQGISHFTIFNQDKKPVCERLYFTYPSRKLSFDIKTDLPVYEGRKPVNIHINASAGTGGANAATMSMSVFRIDSLQTLGGIGINEYLLLGSDLAGPVESIGYYFDSNYTDTRTAMDNLLLTKGWRRFRWEDVLTNKKPFFQYRPEFNGHVISGRVVDTRTGKPAPGVKSYLSAPGIHSAFRSSVSDDSGHVRYELKNFFGTTSIVVQAAPEYGDQYRVQIDPSFANTYTQSSTAPFSMPAFSPVTLTNRSIGVQTENVYQGEKRRQFNFDVIDTSSFYHAANEIYLLDNYTRFTTMEEVLREYVFAVNVRRRNGKFHLPVFNDAALFNGLFDQDPLVLLDGVPVFDMDKLMKYDPLKIRKLETVTRRYYYGNTSFDGIINVSTYNGDFEGYELDPQATVIDYEALQLEREFYAPVYSSEKEFNSHIPDFRNVLTWQPVINTGAQGHYQSRFYTSDLPGKYAVIVQGLSADGKAGSGLSFFEVLPRKKSQRP